jgi:hypothetical protein
LGKKERGEDNMSETGTLDRTAYITRGGITSEWATKATRKKNTTSNSNITGDGGR